MYCYKECSEYYANVVFTLCHKCAYIVLQLWYDVEIVIKLHRMFIF